MGAVYRADHLFLKRPVALKVISSRYALSSDAVERFKREAATVANLKHPNIVTVFDFGLCPRAGAYLAMEYLAGRSLRDQLERSGSLPLEVLVPLALQVCSAIGAAHARGIVHRDLKPDNIFLVEDAESPLVKILDFGLAKIFSASRAGAALTIEGQVLGTPPYMSPEQWLGGQIDQRSDIYAVGCITHELVTGRPPFLADSLHGYRSLHLDSRPMPASASRPGIPPELSSAILRALAKTPSERFAAIEDFADVLVATGRAIGIEAASIPVSLRNASVISLMSSTQQLDDRARPSAADTIVEAAPNNLPLQMTSYVGRERETELIRQLLATKRMVSVTGPGGMGKTRLALEVAAMVAADNPAGVWFVDLAAVADTSKVPQAVARVVGTREKVGSSVTETLIEHLGPARMLLLLDNCEHVIDETAALCELLVRSCRSIRILATSREALGIPGEHAFKLSVLDHPTDGRAINSENAAEFGAVQLFVDRALQADPSFELSDANAAAIATLCEKLEGIPLALELAAARLPVLGLDQMLVRLDDRFHLLTGERRGVGLRQQTLKTTIDWSYSLLAPSEQSLLQALSVFRGGWTLEAAEGTSDVLTDPGGMDAWRDLSRLIDKSLVVADGWGGGVRYRMLETIRQYAYEKLTESGNLEPVRRAHLAWHTQLAEASAAEENGPRQVSCNKQLEIEHDNLRFALSTCVEYRLKQEALRLATLLGGFWEAHSHLTEGRSWLQSVLAENPDGDLHLRARAYYWEGSLALRQGNPGAAEIALRASIDIWRATGNHGSTATALQRLGEAAEMAGDYGRAEEHYKESLAISTAVNNDHGVALATSSLGLLAMDTGDNDSARVLFHTSLDIMREIGDRRNCDPILHNLGDLAYRRGDFAEALDNLNEALAIASEVGNRRSCALTLHLQANVHVALGDVEQARKAAFDAGEYAIQLSDAGTSAYVLETYARIAVTEGRADKALMLAAAAQGLRDKTGVLLTPVERDELNRYLDAAAARADEVTASRCRRDGARMTLLAALDLARSTGE